MLTVLTAANSDFKILYEYLKHSVANQGYPLITYDLGNLGEGHPFEARISHEDRAKIPSKPSIIKDALDKITDGEYLVWMDSDTLMVGSLEYVEQDYDIGVTLRPQRHMLPVFEEIPINAGVIFFRKTPALMQFMEVWIKACETAKSDQTELNKLIQLTSEDMESVVTQQGVKVKVFSCEEYNNYFFFEDQSNAKILHFKSDVRFAHPAARANHGNL